MPSPNPCNLPETPNFQQILTLFFPTNIVIVCVTLQRTCNQVAGWYEIARVWASSGGRNLIDQPQRVCSRAISLELQLIDKRLISLQPTT